MRFFEAFRAGLRELGYAEGRNIILEPRWARGDAERAVELAAELGHRLISTQPDADRGELAESQVVGGELFIAGRDGSKVLELVEESFDEVAVPVQEGA